MEPKKVFKTGLGQSLEVYENKIVLNRGAFAPTFGGNKTIMLNQINAIQLKPPVLWGNGYIDFTFTGGTENAKENRMDFPFTKKKDFQEAQMLIEELRSAM